MMRIKPLFTLQYCTVSSFPSLGRRETNSSVCQSNWWRPRVGKMGLSRRLGEPTRLPSSASLLSTRSADAAGLSWDVWSLITAAWTSTEFYRSCLSSDSHSGFASVMERGLLGAPGWFSLSKQKAVIVWMNVFSRRLFMPALVWAVSNRVHFQ